MDVIRDAHDKTVPLDIYPQLWTLHTIWDNNLDFPILYHVLAIYFHFLFRV